MKIHRRIKHRKIFKISLILSQIIKLFFLHLSWGGNMIFIGLTLGGFFLFFPFLEVQGISTQSFFAFHKNIGGFWFWMLSIEIFGLFILLSKKYSSLFFKKIHNFIVEYQILFFIGIFKILFYTSIYFIILGIQRIAYPTIIITIQTPIFIIEIISSILIIFGSILQYKEKKMDILHKTHVSNMQNYTEDELDVYKKIIDSHSGKTEKNMKLPI